jgi:hypothetical protein
VSYLYTRYKEKFVSICDARQNQTLNQNPRHGRAEVFGSSLLLLSRAQQRYIFRRFAGDFFQRERRASDPLSMPESTPATEETLKPSFWAAEISFRKHKISYRLGISRI